MNVKEQLIFYLNSKFSNREEIIKFTKDNALYYSISSIFEINLEKQFYYRINKIKYEIYLQNSLRIINSFSLKKINYVCFKGILLANQIYDISTKRYVGDIDIYISEKEFLLALDQVIKMGYDFYDENTLNNKHHIVLTNGTTIIELHKHIFNPLIGIDETFIKNNLTTIAINRQPVTTFNTTATFLHLIYHLYMDTYLTYSNLYDILVTKSIPKVKRFLYRAYEIALFSEKYFDKINWDEIIKDIKKQNLRIVFKMMIAKIIEIFPNAFSIEFINAVNNIVYKENEIDIILKYFIKSNEKNAEQAICNYIDKDWNNHKNILLKAGETFVLTKQADDLLKIKFDCKTYTEKQSNGLFLQFTIADPNIYISEIDNYNTQESDGVHLILCGTEKFSYNSIFFFPKKINNKIKAIPCEVSTETYAAVDENLIKTDYEETTDGYIIKALLSNEFLNKNHIKNFFYMGLIISDCCSEKKKRVNEIVLAEDNSKWYNPVFFAKVLLN